MTNDLPRLHHVTDPIAFQYRDERDTGMPRSYGFFINRDPNWLYPVFRNVADPGGAKYVEWLTAPHGDVLHAAERNGFYMDYTDGTVPQVHAVLSAVISPLWTVGTPMPGGLVDVHIGARARLWYTCWLDDAFAILAGLQHIIDTEHLAGSPTDELEPVDMTAGIPQLLDVTGTSNRGMTLPPGS
jgi:hypothetical protein